jgi:hypothetical protein
MQSILFEGQEVLLIPFKKSGFLSGYPKREVDRPKEAGEFKPLLQITPLNRRLFEAEKHREI